jgi:putative flippase GtrA
MKLPLDIHNGIIKHRQFIRFLFVGVINTIFGYAVYGLCLLAGLHYSIASLTATCLGVLFNFNTTGKFVFKNKNKWLLIQFIGVYAAMYAIGVAFIAMLHTYVESLYACGAITTVCMPLLSFYLNKHYVFSPIKQPS